MSDETKKPFERDVTRDPGAVQPPFGGSTQRPDVPGAVSSTREAAPVPAASSPLPTEHAHPRMADQPLPVCDYTGESDAPCEEPTTVRRWSSAAVITSSAFGAVVGGVLVAIGLMWALGLLPGARPLGATTGGSPVTQAQNVTISPNAPSADIAEAVASKAVPSVVNVTIEQSQTDPFTGKTAYAAVGNASGVIIRPDGYIVTNNHVVSGADRVLVSVGVENKVAKIVGVDPTTDLAVIKIDSTGLPAIAIGSSKDLQVGQWVMAVGSPFGLEKTVTSGIISALQRSEQAQGQNANDITTYANLIQTDAAINPGNSGGALVDERGKLVGLNSLIQSPSGGVGAAQSAGIGFAIPVDFVMDIANQLIKSGKATHPFLGVSTQTVDEALAAQYSLPVKSGALVSFVQAGGPGAAAGIKRGDIIVKIGATSVSSVGDVYAAIRLHQIGDRVVVQLVRADTSLAVNVTLGSDASRK